jgi:hypothetical protein
MCICVCIFVCVSLGCLCVCSLSGMEPSDNSLAFPARAARRLHGRSGLRSVEVVSSVFDYIMFHLAAFLDDCSMHSLCACDAYSQRGCQRSTAEVFYICQCVPAHGSDYHAMHTCHHIFMASVANYSMACLDCQMFFCQQLFAIRVSCPHRLTISAAAEWVKLITQYKLNLPNDLSDMTFMTWCQQVLDSVRPRGVCGHSCANSCVWRDKHDRRQLFQDNPAGACIQGVVRGAYGTDLKWCTPRPLDFVPITIYQQVRMLPL